MHTVAPSSAQLEDVRNQALTALTSVREELQGAGGMSFEESQMMINSGIDGGEDDRCIISATVDTASRDMMATDWAAAQVAGPGLTRLTVVVRGGRPSVGLP